MDRTLGIYLGADTLRLTGETGTDVSTGSLATVFRGVGFGSGSISFGMLLDLNLERLSRRFLVNSVDSVCLLCCGRSRGFVTSKTLLSRWWRPVFEMFPMAGSNKESWWMAGTFFAF